MMDIVISRFDHSTIVYIYGNLSLSYKHMQELLVNYK